MRDMDGQMILKCNSVPVGTGILDNELIKRARSIGMLHVPTEEELAREKAEQERLEAEKAEQEAELAAQQSTNSTFEVHFGGGSAIDIGFEDSGAGIVNIRTSSGKVQYNLGSKTMKKVE